MLENVIEKYTDIVEVDYLGIDSFCESCINYSIKIVCKRMTQWDMKRNILKEIKLTYDKNKIKIPYNQLEVHNGK